MKKHFCKKYQKPKIKENKIKTNFLSFIYRDPVGDFLVLDYCGRCPFSNCACARDPHGCDLWEC